MIVQCFVPAGTARGSKKDSSGLLLLVHSPTKHAAKSTKQR